MKGCGREHIEIMQEDTSDWNAQECVQQQTCVDVVNLWQCSALPVSLMICVDMCFFLLGTIHPPVLSLMNAQLYLHCELSALVDLDLVRQLFLEFHRTFFLNHNKLRKKEVKSSRKRVLRQANSRMPHRSPRALKGPRHRNHLVQRRGATWRMPSWLRNPNNFCHRLSHDLRPSRRKVLQEFTGCGPSEGGEEPCSFFGASASHFRRQHDQTRRKQASGTCLPCACGPVSGLHLLALPSWCKERHHSGVDGQVDASVVRRPVPPLPAICGTYGRAVPDPCRAANGCTDSGSTNSACSGHR